MARSTDLLHELTTGKPPPPRPHWLHKRWVREVIALTIAGSLTLALYLIGGLTVLTALMLVGVTATPVALVAATFALKSRPETRAVKAAAPDEDSL